MKKFIETLKNIWKIQELRNRILYTLGLLLVFRFGSYVVLPGVNAAVLAKSGSAGGNPNYLLGLLNVFTGGSFNKGAIFALGVMPYITASIIIQLLTFAVPFFQRLQQKEGESGRKKISQYTRLLAIPITLVQGGAYLTYLSSQPGVMEPGIIYWLCNTIVLTTGTIFAMWLGEKITDRGIGNGISFIIMSGIIDALPRALATEFSLKTSTSGGILGFILDILMFVAIIMFTIIIIQGIRKIPIQFAKRMVGRSGDFMPAAGNRDYIPVKLNASGVMPIIFAQALMFLPMTVGQYLSKSNPDWATNTFFRAMSDFTSIPYNLVYFVLVVVFTYVYTALIVNPQQYSEYLKRQNAFIPGIKPGAHTAEFIDTVTTRITLPGSVFLALIAVLPAFSRMLNIGGDFARFFGGTSLLIMIGVILDTLQQIESHLLMRRYDGLVKSGRLKGRGGVGMQVGANM